MGILEPFCLAIAIYWEARGEPIVGQFAVGQVILNRVKSKEWPNNICEVVTQRKQFSFYNDGKGDIPKDQKAWNRAKVVAQRLLTKSEMHQPLPDVTKGSNHYHSKKVDPFWSKNKKEKVVINNHIFYKF